MNQEEFFNSEVVRDELEDIQETYTELLKMSNKLSQFAPQERLDHINKTLELIAKQKVFYARLSLASTYVQEDTDHDNDGTVSDVKQRIDDVSKMYSSGMDLTYILNSMEEKLKQWKRQIKEQEKDVVDND